jgi:hypothetical protein
MTVLANTSINLLQKIDPYGGLASCWLFTGAKYRSGHGKIMRRKKQIRAHRWSYEHHYGVTLKEEEDVVRHTCDNPSCCNPLHLLLGTQADNMRDKTERGRARNQHKPIVQTELNRMKELKQIGLSYRQIAKQLNRSVWSICYWEKQNFVLPSTNSLSKSS